MGKLVLVESEIDLRGGDFARRAVIPVRSAAIETSVDPSHFAQMVDSEAGVNRAQVYGPFQDWQLRFPRRDHCR